MGFEYSENHYSKSFRLPFLWCIHYSFCKSMFLKQGYRYQYLGKAFSSKFITDTQSWLLNTIFGLKTILQQDRTQQGISQLPPQ